MSSYSCGGLDPNFRNSPSLLPLPPTFSSSSLQTPQQQQSLALPPLSKQLALFSQQLPNPAHSKLASPAIQYTAPARTWENSAHEFNVSRQWAYTWSGWHWWCKPQQKKFTSSFWMLWMLQVHQPSTSRGARRAATLDFPPLPSASSVFYQRFPCSFTPIYYRKEIKYIQNNITAELDSVLFQIFQEEWKLSFPTQW